LAKSNNQSILSCPRPRGYTNAGTQIDEITTIDTSFMLIQYQTPSSLGTITNRLAISTAPSNMPSVLRICSRRETTIALWVRPSSRQGIPRQRSRHFNAPWTFSRKRIRASARCSPTRSRRLGSHHVRPQNSRPWRLSWLSVPRYSLVGRERSQQRSRYLAAGTASGFSRISRLFRSQ